MPLILRVRRFVFACLFMLASAGASAQNLYLPVGESGFGLAGSTTFNDGGVTDGAVQVTVSPSPAVDLAASAAAFDFGSRSARSIGAGATIYLQRSTPTRSGVTLAVSSTSGDVPTSTAGALGLFVARQIDAGGFFLVPLAAFNVGYVTGDRVDEGIRTAASAGISLLTPGAVRVYVGPSVVADFEAQRVAFVVRAGVLTL